MTTSRPRSKVSGAEYNLRVADKATSLTVPDAAAVAEIVIMSGGLNYTRDGSSPSSAKGFPARKGDIIYLNSRAECDEFRAVGTDGGGVTPGW
jgi:hypothetical protein